MKIHRLEVEGFGPFRDRQVVDFDAFAADGIFLIGGRTGAGKSSILDAICFALYGGVPRYDEGEKRFRSDHSDLDEPSAVVLEFSAAGERWRVERVPQYERRKRSGTGTTTSPPEARLAQLVGGEWVGRASKPGDVGRELEPVLGLTQAQFLQVILLAQGRFARFLLAKNDERQALLRSLFDSRRFADYEAVLDERRRAVQAELDAESGTLRLRLEEVERLSAELEAVGADADPDAVRPADDDVAARLAAAEHAALRAAHAAEVAAAREAQAASAREAAADAYARAATQREQQERRSAARTALHELESSAPEVAARREERRAAAEAEGLRELIDAAGRAEVADTAARVVLSAAHAAWAAAGAEPPATFDAVEDELARIAADEAAVRAALEAERDLARADAQRAELADGIARLAEADRAARERRDAIPAALHEQREAEAARRVVASRGDAARASVAEAQSRVAAAREEQDRSAAVAEAERVAAAAGRALTASSAQLDALRERRFLDRAGELAEHLVDGDPCPVCGAVEHPAPAPRIDDPVTPEAIAAAEAAKDAAVTADRDAAAALVAAREARSAAALRAGGLGVEAAEAALAEAAAALGEAEAAGEERTRILAEIAALEAEQTRLDTEVGAIAELLQSARTEIAGLDGRRAAAVRTVEAARAGHTSVEARLSSVQSSLARARAYASALRDAGARAENRADAEARLAGALARTGFPDVAAARAALRTEAQHAALDALIREHTIALEKTKSVLLELELAALPEEPVALDALALERDAATAAWSRAVADGARAGGLAAQLAAAVERASAAHRDRSELEEAAGAVQRLADTVAGRAPNTMRMNLETFVLAAELEQIVVAANLRLDEMSQGRYRLRHTDARAVRGAASGLGIEVLDRHTGMARPVHSLSGGETFLASLALALGLAEVVTARAGGITLDTLFIDEGFGSLDADTLEVAMRTLDELRQGGRTVGVISHVEAMKDAIPAHVVVESTPQGPSVIRQQSSAPVGG